MIVAVGAARAPAQCSEEQKLTAFDVAALDQFGKSVSVSGDTAVVGASYDDCGADDNCGAAYVYRFNGTSWVEQQRLTASDAAAGDRFGESVSVSGDTAVIGARRDGCTVDPDCGSAYVFRFDGASWVEEQKLVADDAAKLDQFGFSVSVSGDTALVGTRWDDCAGGSDCGAAYVFRFNGSSWDQEQKLVADDADNFDVFGWTLSLHGDTAAVGALQDDSATGDNDCGSVYVFRRDGSVWIQEQKLTASDGVEADFFGSAVSVDGDTIAVGAGATDCGAGSDCGSVYMFRFNGTSWVEEQTLTIADAEIQDHFGASVSVSANNVMVGAWGRECLGEFSNCGAVYLFRFNGTSWDQAAELMALDAGGEDRFGGSVSLSGDTAIVGAHWDDCAAGDYCGSAYVFCCVPADIPAASTWGLASLTLLLLTAGTILMRRTVSVSGIAG